MFHKTNKLITPVHFPTECQVDEDIKFFPAEERFYFSPACPEMETSMETLFFKLTL